MSTGKKVALGAGIAAVGAAGYYFLGPKGKEHQKKAKDWTEKTEKKVIDKIKKVEAEIEGKTKKVKGRVMKAKKDILGKAKIFENKGMTKANKIIKNTARKIATSANKIAKKK